jgi:glycosyltransferase involved in cell wall biosynthesis
MTMRILLTGHSCSPNSGSEAGITWNWAANLARSHDVWVITHAYFRPAIEAQLAREPMPRLRFVYTDRLGWWDPLRFPSKRGIQLHYHFWQRRVLQVAAELDAVHDFDLVHHVGWGTVSAPPLLWRLGKPFIWGPLGGGQVTPWRLLGSFGRAIPSELLRTLRVLLLRHSPAVRRAGTEAAAVFSANHETSRFLRQAGVAAPTLFADVGVPRSLLDQAPPQRPLHGPFIVSWAGLLEPRKGVGLCVEVARRVTAPGVRFLIAGDGPLARSARREVERHGLGERVTFLGQLPWAEVQALHRSAHVFLFTSIRDTLGTAALEALAAGAPVVCIDHQGVGAHLPAAAAVKVPVAGARDVAIAMARAIDTLAADRERVARMAEAGRRYIEVEAWDRRAAAMEAHYGAALERWRRAHGTPRLPVVPAHGSGIPT